MPDVRLPDGTIVKNVPEGTTKKEVMARVSRAREQQTRGGVDERLPRSVFLGTQTPGEGDPRAGAAALATGTALAARAAGSRIRDVADAVINLVEPIATGQTERETAISRGQRAGASLQREARERGITETAVEQGLIPRSGASAAATVGRFAPDVTAGFGAFGAARSITGRILAESALGGVEGLSMDPFATTAAAIQNTGVGAGAGLILGTVGEGRDLFRSFVTGNAVGRALKAREEQMTNIGRDVFRPDEDARLAGFDLSIAESSRSGVLRQTEEMLGEPGGPKEQFVFNRTQDMLQRFTDISRQFSNSDLTFDTALQQSFRVYDDAVNEIRQRAGDSFRTALQPGLRALGASVAKDGTITGGRAVIPLNNFLGSLSRQARVLEEAKDFEAAGQIRKQIQRFEEGDGVITIGGAQEILSDLSAQAAGAGTAATRAASAGSRVKPAITMRALLDDLDEAANTLDSTISRPGQDVLGRRQVDATLEELGEQARGGRALGAGTQPEQTPGVPQQGRATQVEAEELFQVPTTELDMSPQQARVAAKALRDAREAFRTEIAPLNALKKTGIDTLLGGEKLLGIDEFTKSFEGLAFSQKKRVLDLLDSRRPELGNVLRQSMWAEVLSDATVRSTASSVSRGADELIVDTDKLASRLMGSGAQREFDLLVPPGLSDAARTEALAGLQSLAKVNLKPDELRSGLGTIIAGLREKSINFVSQDPGFLARMITGEVGPHVVERWLFTRQGLETLARIRGPKGLRGAVETGAMTQLAELAVDAEVDRQALLAEAEKIAQEEAAKQMQQQVESKGRF
jgi:hypothetical protein